SVIAPSTSGGALVFGWLQRDTLSRSPEGKALLRVRRWYAFYPWVDQIFNLKHYRNVALFYKGPSGDDRSSVLNMFDAPDSDVERFTLKIIHVDGQFETILSCADEEQIRSIGETICRIGGLRFG